MSAEAAWRKRVAERCGGESFDAPGGGYAFSDVLAEERRLGRQNQPGDPVSALLALSIADPVWKMHPDAMAAGVEYYEKESDATRYTDNAGVRAGSGVASLGDTHEVLAERLNRRYPDITQRLTPEWVQYSPGSIKRALAEYVPTLLLEGSSHLVFPTPGYPVIKSPLNRRGAAASDLPMAFDGERWSIPTSVLWEASERPVMYVNLPHNPTGSGYGRESWVELIGWARANCVVLVVDEAYIDVAYRPGIVSVLTVPGWEECCVVLQSVSKGWNATGLRFGWVVGHPTMIKAMRKVMDVKDSGLFGPSIAAGLTCLNHPEWAEETRQRYERLHRVLAEGLAGVGFSSRIPDAGLCQFTPAPRSADGQAFEDAGHCGRWFRDKLRISLMHYTVEGDPWLRWAVTLKPVPECGLGDEESVVQEAVRRLADVQFEF
jgi:aspartate/methionine/tyrosine aminotransferase